MISHQKTQVSIQCVWGGGHLTRGPKENRFPMLRFVFLFCCYCCCCCCTGDGIQVLHHQAIPPPRTRVCACTHTHMPHTDFNLEFLLRAVL